jgi:hypothetical protein
MRRSLPLAVLGLGLALAAYALPVDRGLVEDGTDTTVSSGATDGGVVLLSGQTSARLRPATCAASSCTRDAPDAGTEGLNLEDVAACRLMACGPYDQLLTGTGEQEAWVQDGVTGRWGHMPTKDLPIAVTNERCQAWPVELNGMQAAGVRLLYRPVGVGVSGNDGGSVVTSLQCCRRGPVPLGNTSQSPGCGP